MVAAAHRGYTDVIEILIKNGTDLMFEDRHDALRETAMSGRLAAVALLLRHGMDSNKTEALAMAAEGGRPYSSLQQVSPRRRRGDQNEILKGQDSVAPCGAR